MIKKSFCVFVFHCFFLSLLPDLSSFFLPSFFPSFIPRVWTFSIHPHRSFSHLPHPFLSHFSIPSTFSSLSCNLPCWFPFYFPLSSSFFLPSSHLPSPPSFSFPPSLPPSLLPSYPRRGGTSLFRCSFFRGGTRWQLRSCLCAILTRSTGEQKGQSDKHLISVEYPNCITCDTLCVFIVSSVDLGVLIFSSPE